MYRKLLFILGFIFFAAGSFAADISMDNGDITANGPQIPQQNPKTPAAEPAPLGSNRTYRSIMFTEQNIVDIMNALNRISIGTSNLPLEVEEKRETFNENNIFVYLNSIMYISDNHWTIWVNGGKITNLNNGERDIRALKVSPLSASLVWNLGLSEWEVVNQNNKIPESRYRLKDDRVDLYFSLTSNQTYIPLNDEIIEGKPQIETPKEEAAIKQDTPNKNQPDNSSKEAEIGAHDNIFF